MLLLRFIPPPNAARYAVTRGHFFKTYDDIAVAKRAIYRLHYWGSNAQPTFILETVRGSWFVLYTIMPEMTTDYFPWKQEVEGYRRGLGYVKHRRAVPMSADDYAAWRLAVERELVFGFDESIPPPSNGNNTYSSGLLGAGQTAFSHVSVT